MNLAWRVDYTAGGSYLYYSHVVCAAGTLSLRGLAVAEVAVVDVIRFEKNGYRIKFRKIVHILSSRIQLSI